MKKSVAAGVFAVVASYFIGVFLVVAQLSSEPKSLQTTEFASQTTTPSFTQEQIRRITAELPRSQADKTFYHWTKMEVGVRWILQGSIHQGELDFYNTPTGSRQNYGAGLYLADDPNSSRTFGVFPVAFIMKKGTLQYNADVVQRIVGRLLSDDEITELGKSVPFVRALDKQSWFLTHHPQNASIVRYAGSYGARIQTEKLSGFNDIVPLLLEATKNTEKNSYFENLLFLTRYFDGLSFMSAMELDPGHPERFFEPEHFEKFRNAYGNLLPQINYGPDAVPLGSSGSSAIIRDLGIVSQNGRFGSGDLSAEDWARMQVDRVLPRLFKGVEESETQNPYRSEGIRAGGVEAGQSFYVPTSVAAHMKENPYIELQLKPTADRMGFQAFYYYPDVFHFKQLKGKISDELYLKLENTPQAQLWQDQDLRKALNQRLVRELLLDLFRRNHGKYVNFRDPDSLQFLVDLISIHPFPDKNGRTSRLFYDLAHSRAPVSPPLFPLGDLDLLMSPQFLVEHLNDSQRAYSEMIITYLEEYLNAKSEGRMPDFAMLGKPFEQRPHAKLVESMAAFGDTKRVRVRPEHLKMIQGRRFTELFDQWFGDDWENSDVYSVVKAFKTMKGFPAEEEKLLKRIFTPNFISTLNSSRQAVLLNLAIANGFDLRFINLFAQHGSQEIQKNFANLVPEIFTKNPKVVDDPEFRKLFLNVIARHPSSLSFTQFIFQSPFAESEIGKQGLKIWVDTLKSDTDLNSDIFKIILSSQWLERSPENLQILMEMLGKGNNSLNVSFFNSIDQFPPKLLRTDVATSIYEQFLKLNDPNLRPHLPRYLHKLLDSGMNAQDPRFVRLVEVELQTGQISKTTARVMGHPAVLRTVRGQQWLRTIAKSVEREPQFLGPVLQDMLSNSESLKIPAVWNVILGLIKSPAKSQLSGSLMTILGKMPKEFYESKASEILFEAILKAQDGFMDIYGCHFLRNFLIHGIDGSSEKFQRLFAMAPYHQSQYREYLYPLLSYASFRKSPGAQKLKSVLISDLKKQDKDAILGALGLFKTLDWEAAEARELGFHVLAVVNEQWKPDFVSAMLLGARERSTDSFFVIARALMRSNKMDYKLSIVRVIQRPLNDVDPEFYTRAFDLLIELADSRDLLQTIYSTLSVGEFSTHLRWSNPKFVQLYHRLSPHLHTVQKLNLLLLPGAENSALAGRILGQLIATNTGDRSIEDAVANLLSSRVPLTSPARRLILLGIAASNSSKLQTAYATELAQIPGRNRRCESVFSAR